MPMPLYRITIDVYTNQDPSAVLEVAEQFAEDLPENCWPERCRVSETSVQMIDVGPERVVSWKVQETPTGAVLTINDQEFDLSLSALSIAEDITKAACGEAS